MKSRATRDQSLPRSSSSSRKAAASHTAKTAEAAEQSSGFIALGQILRDARTRASKTQEQIAAIQDSVAVDTIQRFEKGKGGKHATFKLLVAALNTCTTSSLDADALWAEHVTKLPEGAPGLAKNPASLHIAYKVWWELTTRKIALELDEAHDLLTEVYDSWYAAFGLIRDYARELPVGSRAEHSAALEVMNLCSRLLNGAMRPHLTRWQAEFRAWRTSPITLKAHAKLRPQDVDKQFPAYAAMIKDLDKANDLIIDLEQEFRPLIFGKHQPMP